ncbi:MAG: prepilin-type N-terminal cleavage/methylation domain-containing protein [Deltaproteobacteria bacterium]|nr:prepilin-type N-terminal cleavage/methylation domain-containing protein [Deltaproteobacteria bacterium]
MRRFLKKQAGITMIELILSMSLMGLVSVVAMNQWNFQRPAVYTSTLKVAQDIRYARHRAVLTGQAHGFRNISSTTYEVYEVSSGEAVRNPSTGQSMVIDLAEQFGQSTFQGNYQVEFDNIGSPTLGSGATISLASGDEMLSLSIEPDTGVVNLDF